MVHCVMTEQCHNIITNTNLIKADNIGNDIEIDTRVFYHDNSLRRKKMIIGENCFRRK